ncbi:hypothetical protein [Pseudomonas shirazensis]
MRYERLLFWAAPITLAACAVLIITLGHNTYEDRRVANCYDQAAVVIESDAQLVGAWSIAQLESKRDRSKVPIIMYGGDVAKKLIYGLNSTCWNGLVEQRDSLEQSPISLVGEFKKNAEDLRKKPIKLYGVEIPDVATVGLAGTKIQIAMSSFVQAFQIALAPIMLLWLGSLYHTRQREITSIKMSESILSVHPHVINVFPVGYYPELRRKNWFRAKAPFAWSFIFALIRMSLVAIFILPSSALYVGSLFYQPMFGYWLLNCFAGAWVFLYALGALMIEVDVGVKHFPGANALR